MRRVSQRNGEAYFTQKVRSVFFVIVSSCDNDPAAKDFLLSHGSDAGVHWPHWTPLVQDDDPQEDDVQEAADAVKTADDSDDNVEPETREKKKWIQQHENMWKGVHEHRGSRSTLARIRATYDAGSLFHRTRSSTA